MNENTDGLVSSEKLLTCPLYEYENRQLHYSDFADSLRTVGINDGDIIFVHSDIAAFGKLCVFDREFLLNALIEAMKVAVGEEGTIIMPTFSYSFCENHEYDITNSKSVVGALTEHFRKQPDVLRTNHPIFSVGIWGKCKKWLAKIGKDAFDEDSIFRKVHSLNGKIVFFGAPFQSCTYIHYIEQTHGVPYRHMKSFKGMIKEKDNEYEDECTYFVRNLDENVITDLSGLERYMLEKGFIRSVTLGSGKILMVEADVLFNVGCKLLDKDIHFFLK